LTSSNRRLPKESLFEFPCQFEIKAMGRKSEVFELLVRKVVNRHLVGEPILGAHTRPSRQGRYVSVSFLIDAVSRAQLDAIYLDLNSEPEVLMTL